LQKFDIVTIFIGVYLGIQKFRARNPVYHSIRMWILVFKKCAKTHLRASETSKKFSGGFAPGPPRKEGKEKEGRERNGTERKGKMCPQGKILRTPLVNAILTHFLFSNF
jgi:hypothetical protein